MRTGSCAIGLLCILGGTLAIPKVASARSPTEGTQEVNPLIECGPGTGVDCKRASMRAGPAIHTAMAAMTLMKPDFQVPAAALAPKEGTGISPSTKPQSKLYSPDDSGLVDCGTPADQLMAACKNGEMCFNVSPSQFPEVVLLHTPISKPAATCTGTVISPNWILTAAHCLVGDLPVSHFVKSGDYTLPNPQAIKIYASNALSLSTNDQKRIGKAAFVFHGYAGGTDNQANDHDGDLALIQIDPPYPAQSVPPDNIADPKSFNTTSTSTGYGYSNQPSKITLDTFAVAWLPALTPILSGKFFRFNMAADANVKLHGAFCEGDSGGPVFIGRARGCRPTDKPEGEARPRSIQGINISYKQGIVVQTDPKDKEEVESCQTSGEMRVGSVLYADRHNWICEISKRAPPIAMGCP